MKNVLFSFVLLVPIVLGLWALIGIYVYRDAKRRGMNSALWTLIALLTPGLIGFIIYLLVRGSYSDLECPQCSAPVSEEYVVCPQCGAKLRPACPGCAAPVEPDWRVCPRCAAPLDGANSGVTPPHRRQDTGLRKILIAVILVPLLLIVFGVLSFAVFQTSGSTGGGALAKFTVDEYDQAQHDQTAREAVHDWLDGLEVRQDRAYALQYSYYDEFDAKQKYYYLIYAPGGGQSPTTSFGSRTGVFGSQVLELQLEETGDSGGLYAVSWRTTEDRAPKPEVILGGKRVRCEVREVEFNPTPFIVIPDYADAEFWDGQFLPERLSVVKIVDNANVGAVEVADRDTMFKILSAIDSGDRVPMDQIPDYDFRDGFEIIVEYQIRDGLIMHEDMARHMALMEDGVCWLDDSRVRNTTHGSSFRQMDGEFYDLLKSLF